MEKNIEMYFKIIASIIILICYFLIVFDVNIDTEEGFIIYYTVNFKRKSYKLW